MMDSMINQNKIFKELKLLISLNTRPVCETSLL